MRRALLCRLKHGTFSSMVDSHVLHKITEWPWLRGTSKIMLYHPPCHGQEHLSLEEIAHSHIWVASDAARDGASATSQPVPVPQHCHSKEFPPNIWSNLLYFMPLILAGHPPDAVEEEYSSSPGFSCAFLCLAVLSSAPRWADLSAQPKPKILCRLCRQTHCTELPGHRVVGFDSHSVFCIAQGLEGNSRGWMLYGR